MIVVLLGVMLSGSCVQGFMIIESYEHYMTMNEIAPSEYIRAQSFTAGDGSGHRLLAAVSLYGYVDKSEEGSFEVKIVTTDHNLPTDTILSTGSIMTSQIPSDEASWFTIPMSPAVLQGSTKYAFEFRVTNPHSEVHVFWRICEQLIGMYYRGDFLYYQGGIWNNDPTIDFRFRIWGYDSHMAIRGMP